MSIDVRHMITNVWCIVRLTNSWHTVHIYLLIKYARKQYVIAIYFIATTVCVAVRIIGCLFRLYVCLIDLIHYLIFIPYHCNHLFITNSRVFIVLVIDDTCICVFRSGSTSQCSGYSGWRSTVHDEKPGDRESLRSGHVTRKNETQVRYHNNNSRTL